MDFEYLNGHEEATIHTRILLHLYEKFRKKVPDGSPFREVVVRRREMMRTIMKGNHVDVDEKLLQKHLNEYKPELRQDSYSDFMGHLSNPEGFGAEDLKPLIVGYANGDSSLTKYGKTYVETNLLKN